MLNASAKVLEIFVNVELDYTFSMKVDKYGRFLTERATETSISIYIETAINDANVI